MDENLEEIPIEKCFYNSIDKEIVFILTDGRKIRVPNSEYLPCNQCKD